MAGLLAEKASGAFASHYLTPVAEAERWAATACCGLGHVTSSIPLLIAFFALRTLFQSSPDPKVRRYTCFILAYVPGLQVSKEMNEVYHTFFPSEPPARSTVAVKDLPGESPIEIECIAYVEPAPRARRL